MLELRQALLEMDRRFPEGDSLRRQFSRVAPPRDTRGEIARLCIVMRHQFRLVGGSIGKVLLQRLGDPGMQLLPLALEQGVVGGILHQSMFEGEGGLGQCAAAVHHPRFGELPQALFERFVASRRDAGQQVIGEFATNTGTDLDEFLDRRQPVEASQQRVV